MCCIRSSSSNLCWINLAKPSHCTETSLMLCLSFQDWTLVVTNIQEVIITIGVWHFWTNTTHGLSLQLKCITSESNHTLHYTHCWGHLARPGCCIPLLIGSVISRDIYVCFHVIWPQVTASLSTHKNRFVLYLFNYVYSSRRYSQYNFHAPLVINVLKFWSI